MDFDLFQIFQRKFSANILEQVREEQLPTNTLTVYDKWDCLKNYDIKNVLDHQYAIYNILSVNKDGSLYHIDYELDLKSNNESFSYGGGPIEFMCRSLMDSEKNIKQELVMRYIGITHFDLLPDMFLGLLEFYCEQNDMKGSHCTFINDPKATLRAEYYIYTKDKNNV